MREQIYDRIGSDYSSTRVPDPRLARQILRVLGGAKLVVNVGAGSGSYEPPDSFVVGVEPAIAMIRQRSAAAGPALQAYSHALPFGTSTFDAALAVLTVHHWFDWRLGLSEMARVSRKRIAVFTWDPTSDGFWLHDYLPQLLEADRLKFPEPLAIAAYLGGGEVYPTLIPHDCSDGFLGAYWRRPSAYLDPNVRASISTLVSGASTVGLDRLAEDLADGTWNHKYGAILQQDDLDVGYRLIVSGEPPNQAVAADGAREVQLEPGEHLKDSTS